MQFVRISFMIASSAILLVPGATAASQPQWGAWPTRNMVSSETGLPATFDLDTGENVLWSVDLGTNCYATPVVAEGCIFIGTNNINPRDPRNEGDRGVQLCLNEKDGSLRWQLATPRLSDDRYKDWPMIGLSTPPAVEGNRVYAVTNRYELVCLDIEGQANGNDGPYVHEASHMVPTDQLPLELTKTDGDIIWMLDLINDVGMYPMDGAHSPPMIDGPYLYLNTSNGVDNTHALIRAPEAPSVAVVEKATGRPVAVDGERIGPMIFHANWAPPCMGNVNGENLLFFGGGDGVCYAFRTLPHDSIPAKLQLLERVWRFDADPAAPKENIHTYLRNREVSPTSIMGTPVFHDNKVYFTAGGDIWWGKEQVWLKCVDATRTGDITDTGEVFSYPLEKHSCSTPAIANGLVFVGDCGGKLHCVDALTGEGYWTQQLKGDIWGSALVADGKVYIGSRGGELVILEATKTKRLLAQVKLDAAMATTPVAANGVLYIATLKQLHALKLGAKR